MRIKYNPKAATSITVQLTAFSLYAVYERPQSWCLLFLNFAKSFCPLSGDPKEEAIEAVAHISPLVLRKADQGGRPKLGGRPLAGQLNVDEANRRQLSEALLNFTHFLYQFVNLGFCFAIIIIIIIIIVFLTSVKLRRRGLADDASIEAGLRIPGAVLPVEAVRVQAPLLLRQWGAAGLRGHLLVLIQRPLRLLQHPAALLQPGKVLRDVEVVPVGIIPAGHPVPAAVFRPELHRQRVEEGRLGLPGHFRPLEEAIEKVLLGGRGHPKQPRLLQGKHAFAAALFSNLGAVSGSGAAGGGESDLVLCIRRLAIVGVVVVAGAIRPYKAPVSLDGVNRRGRLLLDGAKGARLTSGHAEEDALKLGILLQKDILLAGDLLQQLLNLRVLPLLTTFADYSIVFGTRFIDPLPGRLIYSGGHLHAGLVVVIGVTRTPVTSA
ncbi:hypothetical protein TYRP_023569 [Tyrophagus putrescentiae]|nr:hypothetical protein TYRP_023569 [Tyrophagus putrescentiae]